MKVALLNQPWNPAVPPVRVGSIAIWTYEVARELAAHCDVSVYSRKARGQPRVRLVNGVRYVRMSTWPAPHTWIGRWLLQRGGPAADVPEAALPGYFSAYFGRVAKALAEEDLDVVHVHNLGQAVAAVRRRHPRSRILLHMHCEWLSQFPREVVEEWVAESDLLVGCSRYITHTIESSWPQFTNKCRTLHNAVDTAAFFPDGPTRALGDVGDEVILFVGRVSPEKALHVLLDSFPAVLRARPRARLVIVGAESVTPREFLAALSGDELVRDLLRFYDASRGYLDSLRAMMDPGIRERVHFVGGLSHDILPDWYRGAKVVVNPSISESFGMTVLEAMACGTPPVVTSVGGMPEVVDNGRCGIVVAPASSEQLTEAVVSLLADDDRRRTLGATAAEFAAANFSWRKVAGDALQLYRGRGSDS